MKYRRISNLFILILLTLPLLALSGCVKNNNPVNATPANETQDVQVFEGQYTSDGPVVNFEETTISSFVPDGMDETPGAGKGYWLVPNDEFVRLYNEEFMAMISAIAGTYGPCDVLAIGVKFEGILSPPGVNEAGYGFAGLYKREVKVVRVLEIKYFWVTYSCPPTWSPSMTQTAQASPSPTLTPLP
ncbi:MAG: hypothetical protein HND47_12460 [Chloroflexi bacterium]|nr:hypothetical protein [Chloroflexota bacterium]